MSAAPLPVLACRHLGSTRASGEHLDHPSAEHRCHLWEQRERIDLRHQQTYCFTGAQRHCPWLSVPPAGQRPGDRELPKKLIAGGGALLVSLLAAGALLFNGLPSGLTLPGGRSVPRAPVAMAAVAITSAQAPTDVAQPVVDPHVIAAGELSPAVLTADKPQSVSARLAPATGGTVLAGNVGVSFSAKALSGASGDVTVKISADPPAGLPGGPAQYSPDGSIVDIAVSDASGKPITTFPDPVNILFKYNQADLAMAHGDPSVLTPAYIIDNLSPELENPLHFPIGTWVFFPPSNSSIDPTDGTISVHTQAIGSIFAVVAAPISYATTLRDAQLYSSFDPQSSELFGTKVKDQTLQVVEPQIGSRLLTRDPATGKYAYVEARDLGPVRAASSVAK